MRSPSYTAEGVSVFCARPPGRQFSINGFCIGRYWSRGPQRTLYVPGPVTRQAGNELIILELHSAASDAAVFVSFSDLGHTEH